MNFFLQLNIFKPLTALLGHPVLNIFLIFALIKKITLVVIVGCHEKYLQTKRGKFLIWSVGYQKSVKELRGFNF